MRNAKYVLPLLAAGVLTTLIGPANADQKTNVSMGMAPAALGGATCGQARLCAYIGQTTFGAPVYRSKNVASVTTPIAGVTCITPKAGVLYIGRIVPVVTVEWGASLFSDLLAFYEDTKVNCPSSALEVRQYDLKGNLNPRVAFNIVVN